MKANKYIFLFLIILSSLVACEQTIDLELPAYENEVVLYGVLIGGEQPKIVLTESTGYFEPLVNRDRLKVLEDAQVTLSDETQTHNLIFDYRMTQYTYWGTNQNGEGIRTTASLGGYTNDEVIIEEGKTYSIEIKHQGRIITSETTVPVKVPLKGASHEIEIFNEPFSPGLTCKRDKIEVNFDDSDEINFYEIKANVETWSYDFCDRFNDTITTEVDSCFRVKNDISYQTFSDESFNGMNYTFQLPNYFYSCSNNIEIDTLSEPQGYSIYKFALHAVSEELFDFKASLSKQRNSEDNPFQEPSTIQSTVEGGIGVFGSKSAPSDTITLRVDERF